MGNILTIIEAALDVALIVAAAYAWRCVREIREEGGEDDDEQ